MIHHSLCFVSLVKREPKRKQCYLKVNFTNLLGFFKKKKKTFGKYSRLNNQDSPIYLHKIHCKLCLIDIYYFKLLQVNRISKYDYMNNDGNNYCNNMQKYFCMLTFSNRKYIKHLTKILTFEGLSLLMIVVLPLLSSPRHKT